MTKREDLSGRTFGMLKVLELNGSRNERAEWRCLCECGNTKLATAYYLKSGVTTSCGCITKKKRSQHFITHGMSKSPTFRTWCEMRNRCNNPKCKRYADYGGRGITVCERWRLFANFLADMGERPSCDHSIDRIDVNGNYEPGNCRWATATVQNNNTRRNIVVQYDGQSMTATQWSHLTGIPAKTIMTRIKSGWSPRDALTIRPIPGSERHLGHWNQASIRGRTPFCGPDQQSPT